MKNILDKSRANALEWKDYPGSIPTFYGYWIVITFDYVDLPDEQRKADEVLTHMDISWPGVSFHQECGEIRFSYQEIPVSDPFQGVFSMYTTAQMGVGGMPYNLLKAYILVMVHQDGISARKCIEKCRQSNLHQDWTYSDAFLCSYAGNTPGHVISKYNKAFKAMDLNLLELAEYIEIVCTKEPEKITLHLALGILYCRIGKNKLARWHLTLYLDRAKIVNVKDREKVNCLIQSAECDDKCDHNCISCSNLEA